MNVVEIDNVSKKFKYSGREFFAVKDVSFSVGKGDIFGLLGPNGAGKTTTLNMIIGILVPDSGRIRIFGKDAQKDVGVLETMSLTSGGSQFHGNLKARDIMNFYGRMYGIEKRERERRISRLVKFFGLESFLERKFWYLSTGQKMRLTFAKAMLNYPKLLLLDEPTLGLDPDIAIRMRDEIKRINRKFGTTIVLTSHYMSEVEQLCNKIAFIDKGSIIDMGITEKVKLKQFSTYDVFISVKEVKKRHILEKYGFHISGNILRNKLPTGENISEMLSFLVRNGLTVMNVETRKPTLEDYFVKMLARNHGRTARSVRRFGDEE